MLAQSSQNVYTVLQKCVLYLHGDLVQGKVIVKKRLGLASS